MAHKTDLRNQRKNTVINSKSKRQEKELDAAISEVIAGLKEKWPDLEILHEREWKLKDVIERLRQDFPDVAFHCFFESSSMRPDGGILSIVGRNGRAFPILIAEKKNQGTNDLRKSEGKPKQAKGNAIERLGKNVIGFRAALRAETIFPFVCFGDGCDFAPDSSILDRVATIAMFGPLNQDCIANPGAAQQFDRGSFYFREDAWTLPEMQQISLRIAESSINYYMQKYGRQHFINSSTLEE